jgi:O-antigen/teichoic acid export membrane protein
MSQLAQAMQQAVSPRLVKQEGSGNRERMLKLSLLTSKYGFFAACFWVIPLYAEIPTVLTFWLKHPPEHSVVFCRIILLMFVCDQLSCSFSTVVLAIGKIARYQIIIGSIHLSTLPLAYALVKLGCNQDSVLLCSLVTVIVATAARGMIVRHVADLPYATWLNVVVARGLAGVLPAVMYVCVFAWLVPPFSGRVVLVSVTAGLVTMAGAFSIGMSAAERKDVVGLARPIFQIALRRKKLARSIA